MAVITPMDVLKWLNALSIVRGESLGIAASDNKKFTLTNRYVVENSVSLWYGPNYPENITLLDSQYYSIDYDSGDITLTDDGLAIVNGQNLYADYMFSPILSSAVSDLIEKNEELLERLTGRKLAQTSITEYIDYDGFEYIQLSHYPVISISSVEYNEAELGSTPSWKQLEGNGVDKDWYSFDRDLSLGRIWLTGKTSISKGRARIKVNYTYGYSSIPGYVKRALILMVVKDILINPVLAGSVLGGYDALINLRLDGIEKEVADSVKLISQNLPRRV